MNEKLLCRNFLCDNFAITTTATVKVRSVFIANLSSCFSASVLSALDKSGVPIGSDDTVVQTRTVDVPHTIFSIRALVVLDETKPTGSLFVLVQAHDYPSDVAAFCKQLVDLLFGRVKRQVSNVKCRRHAQEPILFSSRSLKKSDFLVQFDLFETKKDLELKINKRET